MNYAHAVAIEQSHAAGGKIARAVLAEARAVIAAGPQPEKLHHREMPRRLLRALLGGPLEQFEYRSLAKDIYRQAGRKRVPDQTLRNLLKRGFVACEYRLTDKGREWLEASS